MRNDAIKKEMKAIESKLNSLSTIESNKLKKKNYKISVENNI